MAQRALIVGGGIGGLGTAALLGAAGYEVQVLEKNGRLGGRANLFEAGGFRFDMGPSWYLMPDVFERFFALLGEKVGDHLNLQRLSPSYRIYFKDDGEPVDMFSDIEKDAATFERLEPGSAGVLKKYLASSAYQYEIAVKAFMYKNYDSVFDFLNRTTMVDGRKLSVFSDMHTYVSKFFKDERVRKIMEYQLVFLGSSPYETPALYNIMSHIDFSMGVFYPEGGIYRVIEVLAELGAKRGVSFRTGAEVEEIEIGPDGRACGVRLAGGERITADLVVSNADVAWTDQHLLPPNVRSRTPKYWKTRTLAPSAFIMYLGMKRKLPGLTHHTLVFSKDWKGNFDQIFKEKRLPDDPSFYVCAPSKTDAGVAPDGKENLFVLVPIPAGLELTDADREAYAAKTLRTLGEQIGVPDLEDEIEYRRIYDGADFSRDYHALGGSALGLAHTFRQTAIFRPNNVSRKVPNLYAAGAGTNPGIGMPICLISAELAYKRIRGIRTAGPLTSLEG